MNSKELIQYLSAGTMVVSSVVLAFLSFFLNEHDIESGVLMYIAQALLFAASVFGVDLYLKNYGRSHNKPDQ